MVNLNTENELIKETLASAKTIAMIGVSSIKKEESSNIKRRPSVIVMKYLYLRYLFQTKYESD